MEEVGKCIEPTECDCERLKVFLAAAAAIALLGIAIASKNRAAASEAAAAIAKAMASSRNAVSRETIAAMASAIAIMDTMETDNVSLENQLQRMLDEINGLSQDAFAPIDTVIIVPPA